MTNWTDVSAASPGGRCSGELTGGGPGPKKKSGRKKKKKAKGKEPRLEAPKPPGEDGLVPASEAGEVEAKTVASQVGHGFPVFYPVRLPSGAAYEESSSYLRIKDPRVYHFKDTDGHRHVAYRMVLTVELPHPDRLDQERVETRQQQEDEQRGHPADHGQERAVAHEPRHREDREQHVSAPEDGRPGMGPARSGLQRLGNYLRSRQGCGMVSQQGRWRH